MNWTWIEIEFSRLFTNIFHHQKFIFVYILSLYILSYFSIFSIRPFFYKMDLLETFEFSIIKFLPYIFRFFRFLDLLDPILLIKILDLVDIYA